ncbi:MULTISPECIES: ROK family protein [Virgibacillus]|uniref:Glucokinase n=2 Tax=Virgibacillus TaxID=84406 RepID=A0A024Q932_9BACI|nr:MULTISPECIES: ROK family protein [Virgibacillus]EQB38052.1 hypothetical protein M948_05635 [Virgibacillus sp. CM-4]GGJ51636.1 glucokinase [Virgibacillus kapii]CDQ38436.1 Glucokinase [Virgibacillus massiliensis]
MSYSIGVDIGGTKIAAVILDERGAIVHRSKVNSITNDKEVMFQQVVTCIHGMIEEAEIPLYKVGGMGVGVPGKVDREEGLAVYQNNLPWDNFPIVARLQEMFPISKISIENDVYMAAYAEWEQAMLQKESTFVYITISTGIACSIIHNGIFLRGKGFAGEMGMYPIRNIFGDDSSLEQVASGPAIERIARQMLGKQIQSTHDFFQVYQKGDLNAKRIMISIVDAIAQGMYIVISLLDPHLIVLGGGVINHNPILLDLVKSELRKRLIPEQEGAEERIQLSQLKDDSGVIGAGLIGSC